MNTDRPKGSGINHKEREIRPGNRCQASSVHTENIVFQKGLIQKGSSKITEVRLRDESSFSGA